ncbi:MAG: hypothetical protein KF688_09215 [Pirellulales bacterium]|nr:hypothetical protein [Pirellulales bacterium]
MYLIPNGLLNVDSTGEVVLGAGSPRILAQSGGSLWNRGIVRGGGTIQAPLILVNEGTVQADLPGQALQFLLLNGFPPLHFNSGLIVATNGARLEITGGVNNAFGLQQGIVEARGDSTISFTGTGSNNSTVIGGRLVTTVEGGTSEGLVALNKIRLENVHSEARVEMDAGSILGTFVNDNLLTLTGSTVMGPGTVFSGQGRLMLNDGSLVGSGSSSQSVSSLVNSEGHAIVGVGSVGSSYLRLTNRGLIEAGPSASPGTSKILGIMAQYGQSYYGGPFVNSGTLRATEGFTLMVQTQSSPAATILNSEGNRHGLIEAGLGGIVDFTGNSVEGGTLRTAVPGPDDPPEAVAGLILRLNSITDVRLEGLLDFTKNIQTNPSINVAGVIDNQGELRSSYFWLQQSTTLTGGGIVRIGDVIGGSVGVAVNTYARTFVNQDNTLAIRGTLNGSKLDIVNRGVIQVDGSGKSLTIQANTLTTNPAAALVNSGVIQAIDGATLQLDSVTNFEGSEKGTIHAGDASTVRVQNVLGGRLTSSETGVIQIAQNGSLQNVRIEGEVELISGIGKLAGAIDNHGLYAIRNPSGAQFGPFLDITAPWTRLDGPGELAFTSFATSILISGAPTPAVLINGPQHTIRGWGSILVSGFLENEGTIAAAPTSPLQIVVKRAGRFINNGTLSAVGAGASIEIVTESSRFVNNGILEVGRIFSVAQDSWQSLEVVNAPGGVVHFGTGVGSLRLSSDGPAGTEVTFFNSEGALVVGGGSITLHDASGEDHVTTFRNAGVIRTEPASPLAQAAGISVLGGFEQLATGRLELGLKYAETGGYDRLVVNDGDAVLGGALAISLRNGFVPAIGDQFEVLLADDGAVVGAFAALEVPSLGPGRKWTLDYLPHSVVLGVAALEADFDADGQTASADLAVWQGGFGSTGAMPSAGDADGDGLVDGADFLAWQREFGQGAATIAAQRLVPEPASVALVATEVFALAGVGIRRGRNRDVKMRNTGGPRSVDPVR